MALSLKILAGGAIKKSSYDLLFKSYEKRICLWSLDVCEVKCWNKIARGKNDHWIALESSAPSLDSPNFLLFLQKIFAQYKIPTFLIGPAQGLDPSIVCKAHSRLSFGPMTWPHLLARFMLLEQIYRAQQHYLGHPYSFI